MSHRNGRKPPMGKPNHGRRPPPPPPRSTKDGCPINLVVAVPLTLFYALPRLALDTWRERRR